MAEDLSQDLVDLSRQRPRADVATELRLDHRERRFDVRALEGSGYKTLPCSDGSSRTFASIIRG